MIGHTSLKCNSTALLSQAESSHLRNLYQRLPPIYKFDFPILAQAYNSWESIRDRQQPNHYPSIAN